MVEPAGPVSAEVVTAEEEPPEPEPPAPPTAVKMVVEPVVAPDGPVRADVVTAEDEPRDPPAPPVPVAELAPLAGAVMAETAVAEANEEVPRTGERGLAGCLEGEFCAGLLDEQ